MFVEKVLEIEVDRLFGSCGEVRRTRSATATGAVAKVTLA